MPHLIARRITRALVAATLTVAALSVGVLHPGAAQAATTTYYVAMGDSLGAGTGASPGSNSYVNRIYAHELTRIPGLQLQNLSCGGATTGSVINGPNCGNPSAQLAVAEAFLNAHPGQVAFLTIDIGANDVDGCSNGTTIDKTCLANGLHAVNTNLPVILAHLKTAYPGIRVFGMNYYDPFLAAWLSGPSGQALAQQSAPEADSFNSILASRYLDAQFPTADVSTPFGTDNFALTGTYNNQTEPQNVANICNWTHMCEAGDIHANNTGHAVLAQAFEDLIDLASAPGAPTAPKATPANATASVSWTAPVDHGSAITGYVVTPFVAGVARTAQIFNTPATIDTVTGLANGTTYTFKIAAKNAVGTGPQSAATAPITAGAPAPPTGVRSVSGVTNSTIGALNISYTAGPDHGSPITKFTATCTPSDAGPPKSAVHVGPTAAVISVVVTTGKTYSCRVTATNSRGPSVASAPSAPVTEGAPRQPNAPTATKVASGSLKVLFVAPPNDGAAITAYNSTCRSSNGGVTRSKIGAAGPLTVTGLTAGTTYTCTVAATNSRGASPVSPPSLPALA